MPSLKAAPDRRVMSTATSVPFGACVRQCDTDLEGACTPKPRISRADSRHTTALGACRVTSIADWCAPGDPSAPGPPVYRVTKWQCFPRPRTIRRLVSLAVRKRENPAPRKRSGAKIGRLALEPDQG